MLGLGIGLHKNMFIGGGASTPLLLDTYTNATVAFSLRKLRTDYVGSAIRVRRDSDNSEMNIGFVNNELDTTTLETFCSGTDGFMTTWFDQTTNGFNLTQTALLNQPKIVNSGVVILENSSSAFSTNIGSTQNMTNSSINLTQPFTLFAVGKVNNASDNLNNYYFRNLGGSLLGAGKFSDNNIVSFAGSLHRPFAFPSSQFVNTHLFNTTNSKIWSNSNESGVENVGTRNIVGGIFLNIDYRGVFQEMIIFDTDETANQSGIQSNINSYYSIY